MSTNALFLAQNGPLSASKTRLAIHECESVVGLRQVRYNSNASLVNITTTTTGKENSLIFIPVYMCLGVIARRYVWRLSICSNYTAPVLSQRLESVRLRCSVVVEIIEE